MGKLHALVPPAQVQVLIIMRGPHATPPKHRNCPAASSGPSLQDGTGKKQRWGPPAEYVPLKADSQQLARKRKRKSRWEEAEAEPSKAIVAVQGGAGFPQEIVLSGGIKVSSDRLL